MTDKDFEAWLDEFFARVEYSDDCWNWTGSLTGEPPNNYGRFKLKGITYRAHRESYKYFIGPIPKELFVCHHCDNPRCVNPFHLWLGTNQDNIKDSVNKKRHHESRKTHCKKGHEFDHVTSQGYRLCRTCERERKRIRYARRVRGSQG